MTNGIIATEAGVAVSGSPDYRQILNSQWPSLEIAYEQSISQVVTVNAGLFKVLLYTHNLPFAPAYSWIDVSGYSSLGAGYPTNVGGDTFSISTDGTAVYVTGSATSNYTFTLSGLLRLYNYSPTVIFQAPSYQPSDPKSQTGAVGLAALQNGYDGFIGSSAAQDLSKFSVNTRAKEITIHRSGPISASGDITAFTISHNLGYMPSFMLFQNTDGELNDQVQARTFGDANNLSFAGIQSVLLGNYAYIIFKDPVMQQQV